MTAPPGGGGRDLKVRVKSSKSRTPASRRWLERQLNDPYVAQAKREGLRSRAAYKLAEIDDKYRLFKPGGRVAVSTARSWSCSMIRCPARIPI